MILSLVLSASFHRVLWVVRALSPVAGGSAPVTPQRLVYTVQECRKGNNLWFILFLSYSSNVLTAFEMVAPYGEAQLSAL